MIGYVHFNIVMKTLQQLCETPLYISAKVSIKPNWEDIIEFANASKNIDFEQKKLKMTLMKKIMKNLKKY
jgi:hypothetical protein